MQKFLISNINILKCGKGNLLLPNLDVHQICVGAEHLNLMIGRSHITTWEEMIALPKGEFLCLLLTILSKISNKHEIQHNHLSIFMHLTMATGACMSSVTSVVTT